MRYAVLSLAAAVALSGSAPAAMAQASIDQADIKCLIVLQVVGRDPKQSDQAAKGMFYYLGRLSARGGIPRLEPLMMAEAAKMTPQAAQAELQRCGGELNSKTQEYQAVNQRIAAKVKPAAAPAKK
jgi:hypothetical protein